MPLYNGNYVAPIWVNGVPPTIGETELDIISGVLQGAQVLKGSGAPTSQTAGIVGQKYADTSTTPYTVYQCFGASGGVYTWGTAGDLNVNLAQEYDSTIPYAQGAYCLHEGLLYRATADISTAEAWNSAHWTQVREADELQNHLQDQSNPHGVTKTQIGLGSVDNVLQYSADNPAVKLGTVTLTGAWGGSGGAYTQTITVTGTAVTASSYVELQFTAAQADTLAGSGVGNIYVTNDSGVLTAIAVGGRPTAMTVQCTVEELMIPPSLEFKGNDSFTLYTYGPSSIWDGTMEYSTDGGTWSVWDGTTTLTSGPSDSIYLRGTGNTYVTANPNMGSMQLQGFYFGGNASVIECNGDIETLRDYMTVARSGRIAEPANYRNLFWGCTILKSAPEMTARSVAAYGYYRLYCGCTSLTSAPSVLPAETLNNHSYDSMFLGCSSLLNAPELLAVTLGEYSCSEMFENCTSLKRPPSIRVTTTASHCCDSMFDGCSALEALPELPAVTLEEYCYRFMFAECPNIKLSSIQDSTYTTPYRIPKTGTSSGGGQYETFYMFYNTGGSFTATPTINTTYYTSNTVIPAT